MTFRVPRSSRSADIAMAKSIYLMTARQVATETGPGLHADGGGLFLEVDRKSGRKRWTFIYQWKGKRRQKGLGGITATTLAEARSAADACRRLIAKNVDPIQHGKDQRVAGTTFGEFAPKLVATLTPQWRNAKHIYQWNRSINVEAKALHSIPLADLNTEHVLDVLRPIWSTRPETAARTRQRIEKILDAAKVQGLRSGDNPARWGNHLEHLLPKRQRLTRGHHPALPFKQAPSFMAAVRARSAMAAKALEFTVLTACRTSEVLGAQWAEFDLDAAVWTVPADRMKGGRPHRVPLSTQAKALVEDLQKVAAPDAVYVFQDRTPQDGHLSNMAMNMLLKRMDLTGFTVHGFRSTFRDWAGETTDYPWDVTEAALAHKVGSDVQQAYRRGDALEKRRELMQAWADHCDGKPAPVRDQRLAA